MFPTTKAGFCDVFGNVSEWCEDHFNGFKDYKPHFLYDDFSTPCFDGRHNMIMVSYVSLNLTASFDQLFLDIENVFFCQGGSWVSTGDGASRFARFAFRRHFFQNLGFRLVQSIADSPPIRLVGTPVFVLGVGVEGRYTVVITLFSFTAGTMPTPPLTPPHPTDNMQELRMG